MKYHYVYQTTNLINGKWYRGKHSTENIDDGYLGSGKLLKQAINKYGKHNFSKEILCFCETSKDAFELEELILTDEDINSSECYNLVKGGSGGNKINWTKERRDCLSIKYKGKNNPRYGAIITDEIKKNIRQGHLNSNKRGSKRYINMYDNNGIYIESFTSIRDAANKYNLSEKHISQVCRGKQRTHKGFIFEYTDNIKNN